MYINITMDGLRSHSWLSEHSPLLNINCAVYISDLQEEGGAGWGKVRTFTAVVQVSELVIFCCCGWMDDCVDWCRHSNYFSPEIPMTIGWHMRIVYDNFGLLVERC